MNIHRFLLTTTLFMWHAHSVGMQYLQRFRLNLTPNQSTINRLNKKGHTRLIEAVMLNDTKEVLSLLNQKADPNIAAADDCSFNLPLHLSVILSSGIIELLIARKADINKTDKEKKTALTIACEYARQKTSPSMQIHANNALKILLEAKADTNKGDSPPLKTAIKTGNCELCSLLIQAKADINAYYSDSSSDMTPLHFAIDRIQPTIVALLIQMKADTQLRDNTTNKVPIPFEIPLGQRVDNIVSPFIRHGTDKTPFERAWEGSRINMINPFLKNGSDFDCLPADCQQKAECIAARKEFETRLTPFLHATLTDSSYLLRPLTDIILEYCCISAK